MDKNIFRFANLAVGVLMILGGLAQFFPIGIQNAIVGAYVMVFGVATTLLELPKYDWLGPQIQRYASFMFSFLGRGVFYLFVGSILLHDSWIRYVPGGIIAFFGLIYIVLEFIPSIQLPDNMREEWTSEQV